MTGSINKINETYVCLAIELVFMPESAEEELSFVAGCGSPGVCLLVQLCPSAEESLMGPAGGMGVIR